MEIVLYAGSLYGARQPCSHELINTAKGKSEEWEYLILDHTVCLILSSGTVAATSSAHVQQLADNAHVTSIPDFPI